MMRGRAGRKREKEREERRKIGEIGRWREMEEEGGKREAR